MAFMLYTIKGTDEEGCARPGRLGVEALDRYTVRLRLAEARVVSERVADGRFDGLRRDPRTAGLLAGGGHAGRSAARGTTTCAPTMGRLVA